MTKSWGIAKVLEHLPNNHEALSYVLADVGS
jgi:hypothetical protein